MSHAPPTAWQPPRLDAMTEADRIAWFESNGTYPVPRPRRRYVANQSLGFVDEPTDWSWVAPAIVTTGALYGLYRVKRHNDWDW